MAAHQRFTAAEVRDILLNNENSEDSYDSDERDEEEHVDSSSDYEPPINQPAESSSEDHSNDGDDSDESDTEHAAVGQKSAEESDVEESDVGGRGRHDSVLLSKDKKVVWHCTPLHGAQGRRAAANVMHLNPGPTRYAFRNVDTPASAFGLFLREPLLIEILKWTNKEGAAVFGENWKILDREELLCYIGLLFTLP